MLGLSSIPAQHVAAAVVSTPCQYVVSECTVVRRCVAPSCVCLSQQLEGVLDML
jgi:hypothetical protein